MIRGATGSKNLGFGRNRRFCRKADGSLAARFHGEQVKTSKAGDRATGENRGTCRTRLRPIQRNAREGGRGHS